MALSALLVLQAVKQFRVFAINSKVTVTGMSATTQVSDNLFVAPTTHGANKIAAENTFKTTLVDSVSGLLEPVSTQDGKSFWYSATNNVNGDGQVKLNQWSNYGTTGLTTTAPATKNNFSVNYIPEGTTTAVGFIDYVYDLKAVAGATTTLKLTKLDLRYAALPDAAVDSAFRVAVFIEEASGSGENTGSNYNVTVANDNDDTVASAAVAGISWIFAPNGKATNNFTTYTPAANPSDPDVAVTNAVVTGTGSVATMTYKTDEATMDIGVGTHYYKVVVRLWLEGQDKNCNNTTFAKLDDGKWALTTEWSLGSGTGVSAINVIDVASTSMVDLSSATKDTAKQTINGVTYVELDTAGYWIDDSTSFTYESKVYTIADGQITDVTNIVKLPVAP